MIDYFSEAKVMPSNRRDDADWFRATIVCRGCRVLHLLKANPKELIPSDKAFYRQRHRIENMFGRLENGRRIETPSLPLRHNFKPPSCLPPPSLLSVVMSSDANEALNSSQLA